MGAFVQLTRTDGRPLYVAIAHIVSYYPAEKPDPEEATPEGYVAPNTWISVSSSLGEDLGVMEDYATVERKIFCARRL